MLYLLPRLLLEKENVLDYWCVRDVSLKSPSLAAAKNLSRPFVGEHGMGERFFRGGDLSVPVYDTFATLVDTDWHFFYSITLCSPAFRIITRTL